MRAGTGGRAPDSAQNMIKRLIYSAIILLILGAVAVGLISYGRGYRFNFNQKTLSSTGILSVSSYPEKSSIYIDNKLTSATNASISLAPSWYHVRISKEGYQSWEKDIQIQAEIVSQIDALLVPNNPSFRAITITGIQNPTLSPSGNKVAFIIPSIEASASSSLSPKMGIWIQDLRTGTLGGRSDSKQIFQTATSYDWQNAKLLWSPDEKQIVMVIEKTEGKKTTVKSALSFTTDSVQTLPLDVTSMLSSILAEWQTIIKEKLDNQLAVLPTDLSGFLTEKTSDIRFSPDETKIFYLATGSATLAPVITPPLIGSNPTVEVRTVETGKYYIYDVKEDKNYFIADKKNFENPNSLVWYTDSKHIIMVEKDIISIIDFDGTNKKTVYTGPFLQSLVYSLPSGGKVAILTNFNKPQSLPNLYEIDLR